MGEKTVDDSEEVFLVKMRSKIFKKKKPFILFHCEMIQILPHTIKNYLYRPVTP